MFNDIEDFKNEMMASGLTPPHEIITDGQIHRFATNHKQDDKAGWYVFHQQPVSTGCFGDWRTDRAGDWCAKSRSEMSLAELKAYRTNMAEVKQQREEAKRKLQFEAKERANQIWQMASDQINHPYLIKKGVKAYCARQLQSALLLPIVNFTQEIQSLQYIYPNGDKKLLFGGAKKGHFIPITQLESPTFIMICEGFATGATLAEAFPDRDVIAAIDAQNLSAVALQVRQHWPKAQCMIFADDDRLTPGNPGISKAREASIMSGIPYTTPKWPREAPKHLTDFNDLSHWMIQKSKRREYGTRI